MDVKHILSTQTTADNMNKSLEKLQFKALHDQLGGLEFHAYFLRGHFVTLECQIM